MLKQIKHLVTDTEMPLTAICKAAFLSCALLSSAAQAIPFSSISQVYFFGDSLTDSGFNNLFYALSPPPSYPLGKAPTFTTYGGYTWSQYVAHDIKNFDLPADYNPQASNPVDLITNNTTTLSLPPPLPSPPNSWPVDPVLTGVDYACGGSTTNSLGYSLLWAPSLVAQIENFVSTQSGNLDPDAVYFVWSGANDLLNVISGPEPTELNLLDAAYVATQNIASQVAYLSQHGAKRVVVMALPNLGTTPFVRQAAIDTMNPELPAMLKTVSFTFNSMLNQALGKVIKFYGVKVLFIDTYDLLDQVIQNTIAGKPYVIDGHSFVFTNYQDPACSGVPSAIYCPDNTPTGYIFADGLHPTDEAHQVVSLYVEQAIRDWK